MNCLLSLLLLASVATSAYADCGGYPVGHTMCLPAADCSNANGGPCGPVSAAQKAEILAVHNSYRELVAEGKETRGSPGPQPAGTNIYELKWNDELAKIAQRFAEQLVRGHDCDTCRATITYPMVGQNFAAGGSNVALTEAYWTPRVRSWIDKEVINMNGPQLIGADGKVVGHYTQVVWASSKEVGCGAYGNNQDCGGLVQGWAGYKCVFYVCNYGPSGNMVGAKPYSTTDKCAKYSTNYPKLCVD